MNKLLLSIVLLISTTTSGLADVSDKFSYSSNTVSQNKNPVILKQDGKNIEFKTNSCYNKNYTTNVRMMLVDTSNSAETIIKENVYFDDLDVDKIYSYTFDNYTDRYLIMVNGVCKQEPFNNPNVSIN